LPSSGPDGMSPTFPTGTIAMHAAPRPAPTVGGRPRFRGRGVTMQVRQLLGHVLDDDALTRGLGDEEARVLVEWLVDEAERLAAADPPDPRVEAQVVGLCRRALAIGRFAELWCHRGLTGPAGQLANAEAFG